MEVRVISLLLILLIMGSLTLCHNGNSGEYISDVPESIKGQWVQSLSDENKFFDCKPARLIITDHSIIEYSMDCGEDDGTSTEFVIKKIVKEIEDQWFRDDKISYGLIGSFPAIDATFSWVIETWELSTSIHIYITDPDEIGHREVGTFVRKQSRSD